MIDEFETWIFDCDGVLFDSNRVKTEAFRVLGNDYGPGIGDALVAYHVAHGGISRFVKVDYLFRELLGRTPTDEERAVAAARFGALVQEGMGTAAETPGARALLEALRARDATCYVVSGGMTSELRDEFEARGLAQFFREIHGSPPSKEETLEELARSFERRSAVYLGDSRYDHEAATKAGLDFVFVSGWTEFEGWAAYARDHDLRCIGTLLDLLPS